MTSFTAPIVSAIPCFRDNYIWHIASQAGDYLVDPGDGAAAIAFQSEREAPLLGVLITHHHFDHCGGIATIKQHFPNTTVYGPRENIEGIEHWLDAPSQLSLPGLGNVAVLDVAAHTLGHIAYYSEAYGLLFCGDSLFSAGCGRLFEGDADHLLRVMQQFQQLPAHTKVYPAHEYTLSNLAFAAVVEPNNSEIASYKQQVEASLALGKPSLPSTLMTEFSVNPFLRFEHASVRQSIQNLSESSSNRDVLAALRQWKDDF